MRFIQEYSLAIPYFTYDFLLLFNLNVNNCACMQIQNVHLNMHEIYAQ